MERDGFGAAAIHHRRSVSKPTPMSPAISTQLAPSLRRDWAYSTMRVLSAGEYRLPRAGSCKARAARRAFIPDTRTRSAGYVRTGQGETVLSAARRRIMVEQARRVLGHPAHDAARRRGSTVRRGCCVPAAPAPTHEGLEEVPGSLTVVVPVGAWVVPLAPKSRKRRSV